MGEGPLRVERDERGIVTVTLDRPEVRNAFDAELIRSLRTAFDELARDDEARVVILTGAGEVFSAGADLNWMKGLVGYSYEDNLADARFFEAMLRAVDGCPAPLVARVNGHALGGGLGLIACADVAIAVDDAAFGFSEVRLGIAPAVISPYVLPRIGVSNARRLFLTGERFDSRRAVGIGLVTAAVPRADLDGAVGAVVADLLACGPEAQRAMKRLIPLVAAARDLDEAAEHTVETIARLRVSADGQEGMAAFFERRPPSWT